MLSASIASVVADDVVGAGPCTSGSFYIGIDLENYVGSDKTNVYSGWNSNTDDIYAIMNFKANAGASVVRFDAFAMFDCCLVFKNGTAYCRY